MILADIRVEVSDGKVKFEMFRDDADRIKSIWADNYEGGWGVFFTHPEFDGMEILILRGGRIENAEHVGTQIRLPDRNERRFQFMFRGIPQLYQYRLTRHMNLFDGDVIRVQKF